MRGREIVVNTLLGLLLVSAYFAPFLLVLAVVWYVDQGIQYFWPGIAHHDVAFGALLSISWLISVVRQLRKQLRKRSWGNAFLSLAVLPVLASVWFADVHSPLGLHETWWILSLLPILVIPENADRTRFQFFAGAAIICAVMSVNAGLLGSGPVAQIVAACVEVGSITWIVTDARRTSSRAENPAPPISISPTRA